MTNSSTNQRQKTRERVRGFIRMLETQRNVTTTEIAAKSKVAASTIYRWLDEDQTSTPTLDSLQKIADAFNVDNPFVAGPATPPTIGPGSGSGPETLREPEATPYDGPSLGSEDLAPDESDWRLATRALELAGYLPGDILRLDMRLRSPREGDVVIAQKIDTAETLIRIYAPPFLVTRSLDPALAAPVLIDRAIDIMGVVTKSVRLRD